MRKWEMRKWEVRKWEMGKWGNEEMAWQRKWLGKQMPYRPAKA
jgi:hypothetical protein